MEVHFPEFARDRGPRYWLKRRNWWAARKKFLRPDHSAEWREQFPREMIPEEYRDINGAGTRSTPFDRLLPLGKPADSDFTFVILGDTGEGDESQYGLLPLLRHIDPAFMIINGDIAYPSGRTGRDRHHDDYLAGMFEPYQGMGIPIWGVPGNHEYYPPDGRGREYFDTFCTRIYQDRWDRYGLRLVPQPGTYWELRDPDRRNDLVVIGVDTGQTGNLDGHHDWWRVWKQREKRDTAQLNWLRERLNQAQRLDHKVIVLFHIPALAKQEHKTDIHLKALHRIISEYSCVRLVTCGHDHNCQIYRTEDFDRFLTQTQGCPPDRGHTPEYIVCGGGGAYLNSTIYKSSAYPCRETFPEPDDWRRQAGYLRWLRWTEKWPLFRFLSHLKEIQELDKDKPSFLSLLKVDVLRQGAKSRIEVTPVYMRNLESLYGDVSDDFELWIMDKDQKIKNAEYLKCLGKENENDPGRMFQL